MQKKKVLFVDDDASMRITLPAILEQKGYSVKAAANVAEAVGLINKEKFDVLISDLNIGQPGDGFTVVSVMRRIQPDAVTFILTGFPDFDSALDAIRNQVDDYLTKPADIAMLVSSMEHKLQNPRPLRSIPAVRAPKLLLDDLGSVLSAWLTSVSGHADLRNVKVSAQERLGSVPDIVAAICHRVLKGGDALDEGLMSLATEHGITRYRQGYRADLIIAETRLLQRSITDFLQDRMMELDVSSLISDVMRIADLVGASSEVSLRSFQEWFLAA